MRIIYILAAVMMLAAAQNTVLYHDVSVERIDEKSVIEHGYLYLTSQKSGPLPDIFHYIEDESSAYIFLQREEASGRDGYFPADRITIRESEQEIRADFLTQGYYKSLVRYKGTPDSWMCGSCSQGTFFFSRRGLLRLIDEENPAIIKRYYIEE
ncbi:MAG: hypothetical protein ACOC2H_00270 [Spirochaetota bacterium]